MKTTSGQQSRVPFRLNSKNLIRGAIFLSIVVSGLIFLRLNWLQALSKREAATRKLVETSAAAFSRTDLASLKGAEADLDSPAYTRIKQGLERIARTEKKARFAYFMTLRNGTVYFLADSEPPDSPDYSPPGQIYTESDPVLLGAFASTDTVITQPLKDRWGTWVSILVPIVATELGNPVIFGFDYPADGWRVESNNDIAGTVGFVLCFYVLTVSLYLLYLKNSRLKDEKAILTKAEKELKTSRDAEHLYSERIRLLLDSAAEAIYGFDVEGRFTFCNSSFLRIMGYEKESDVLGRDTHDLIHHSKADGSILEKEDCSIYSALKRKEGANSDQEVFWRADGSSIPVEYASFPQVHDDTLIGAVVSFHDISIRLEKERFERRTHALFRTMLECHPDVIIFALDEKYRYLAFNENHQRAMKTIWGKDIRIGANMLNEVIGSDADREAARSNFDRTLAGESLVLLEEYGDTALTRSYWQNFYSLIIGDKGVGIGLTCVSLNIDAQKILENRLAENEKILTEAQRVARLGYYIIDTSNGMWQSSHVLDEILGIDESYTKDLEGWIALLSPNTRKITLDRYSDRGPLENQRVECEYEIVRHSDGQRRWVLDVGEVVTVAGQGSERRIGTVWDITERKIAEEKIRGFNSDLEKRVEQRTSELEQVNKELEAFSYSVSHDLRAPLRAIEGFAQILSEKENGIHDELTDRLLDSIRVNADKMKKLIEGLLDLSRLGRDALKVQSLKMNEMVKNLFEVEFADDVARGFSVMVHPLPDARGDQVLVKQVWFNLISNAFKYSAFSAIKTIEIGSDGQKGKFVEYYVKDHGAGFDQAYVGRLFAPFQRLHSEKEFGGTGMGLAIVQRIVARHGGAVSAEGIEGEGAVFRFSLPTA